MRTEDTFQCQKCFRWLDYGWQSAEILPGGRLQCLDCANPEWQFITNPDSFGITQKALKNLRDAICRGWDDRIEIIEIQYAHSLCGFVIINYTQRKTIWSGAGFRTDGGGESGAGYNTVKRLFQVFGFEQPYEWDVIVEEPEIQGTLKDVTEDFPESEYGFVPSEQALKYIRN